MSKSNPTRGDGARSVTLSEATAAVLDELTGCRAKLQPIRRRFGRTENSDAGPEPEMVEGTEEKARDVARHVAARLEACAGALRNASDPSGVPSRGTQID